MRKLYQSLFILVYLVGFVSYSQVNPFASAVWIKRTDIGCANCDQFFNTSTKSVGGYDQQRNAIEPGGGNWTNSKFHARNFSNHISGSGTLLLKGSEIKTIKTSSQNVCEPLLFYKFNDLTRNIIPSSFSSNAIYFYKGCGSPNPNQYNDFLGPCISTGSDTWQKWQVNKIDGLNTPIGLNNPKGISDMTARNEGQYELELFYRIDGSNGGVSGCTQGIGFINDANDDGSSGDNYKATFTICPTLVSSSSANPTTCGGNGTISMLLVGVDDGTYSDRFKYEDASNVTQFFKNITVSGGIAVIAIPKGVYNNVRYQWTATGCNATTVFNIVLTDPLPPSIPTGSSTQNFCKIKSPKISSLVAVGNNVEWFLDSTGGVALATNLDLESRSYYAEQTDFITLCKSITRLKVDVVVDNPAPPNVSLTQTFCNTGRVSDLIPGEYNIKWYADAIMTTPLVNNANLVDGSTYYATQTLTGTLSCESATRASTTVTINISPTPSGSGSQTVCNAGTVANLTATGTNIKWYVNPTGGSALASSVVLISGTTYYASQTIDSCESATRYPLVVTIINPQNPISDGNQSVCSTSPLQTLTPTASVSNGTIVWYDALTNGNVVASPILNSVGTRIYYAQNTIGVCNSTTRTAITLEIKDSPFLSVTSTNCSLDLLTYTVNFNAASGSTISRSPLVGSIVGNTIIGIPAGTAIDITANKGNGCEEVVNVVAPNCSCSPVNNPLSGGDKSVCQGQSNPAISATVSSGETIDWYSASSGGSLLLSSSNSYTPLISLPGVYTYFAEARKTVDGCLSSGRTAVSLTITEQVKPLGSGVQTLCNSGTIANLTATGTNIKWYANPTGGTVLASSVVLISGTTYYATQTVGSCESVTRYPLAVTIINPQIPISGGGQSVCSTSPLQMLTATATVTTGTIVWFDALTNGNLVASPVLNTVGSVEYYAQNKIGSCFSTSRTAVTLEIKDSPFLNITNKSCSLDLLTYTVNFNVATGSTITRSPEVGSIVGNSIIGIPAGTTIDISANKGNGCVEVINVVAPNCSCSPVNNPISGGPKSVCEGQANQSLSAEVNTGEVVDWYSAISGGSPLVSNSLTYTPLNSIPGVYTFFAESRKTVDGCISSGRTPVSLTIAPQVAPTGSATQTLCESINATVANLVATGTTIKWYETFNSTTALSSTLALIDGEDYYATQSATSGLFCESINRFKVTVIIDKPLPPVVISLIQPTCAIDTGGILFSGLPNNGSWILTPSVGSPVSGSGANYEFINLSASTNYTFKVTNGNGCASVLTTPARINAIPASPVVPTALSVVQPTCALQSGTITFAAQNDVEYSIDGINYKSTTQFSGLAPKSYTLYVRNTIDKTCVTSSANATTINSIPNAPIEPSATSLVQPTCAVQSGSITIATQSGVDYSINGISFQSNPIFSGLAPNTYTLYIRNLGDTTCISSSLADSTISALPTAPAIPTITSVIQPTCSIPTGTIVVASQNGVEYSVGNGFQNSPEFKNLVPGKYAISVRFFNNTSCLASGANQVTINSIPESIQFAITGDCENKKYELTANPINNTNFPNDVFFEWKDSNSSPIGSDSNVLNVSDILASTLEKEDFPLEYNLTISSSSTGCETTNKITVTSVFCDIQKGISPDGNGSNDNFDLSFRKVKKLEIFNRYGLKLYSKMNYTNQWEGQTDNGDILPSATYYYVIEFNTGEEPITGWIYLIRNNDK